MNEANPFETQSPLKSYLSIAMPVVFSMVISVIYNIADTYFIAQTQSTQLVAGVSLCAPVFTILMAFGNIYGQGGTSLLSRLYGQQKIEDARRVSSFCFYIALLTGIVIGLLAIIFHSPLLYLLGADSETYSYAAPYFITMCAGAPFLVLSFIHMNLLRCEGMASYATIGSVSGLLVNIILDPILILICGMGAFGAALASVIGYVCSDCFYLIIVLKKSRLISVNPSLIRIPGEYISQVFGVGISAAVSNWMSSICLIITNHFLLTYGNDQIAAMGIAQKVMMIVLLIATGLVFGSAPIVGYFYGGKQFDRLKSLLLLVIKIAGGVTLLLSVILFAAARPIIAMFLNDAAVISAGVLMIRFQLITMIFAVAVLIFTVCFQAAGMGMEALIVSICRQGVIFLIVIFITSALFGYMGVITAQAITDVITVLLTGLIFYRRLYSRLK